MTPHDWHVEMPPGECGTLTGPVRRCRRCGCERWGTEIVVLGPDRRVKGTAGDDCGLVVVREVLES